MTQPKQHINCTWATLELNYPGLRLPYSSHAYLIDYTWEGKKCRIPCATRLNGRNCKPVTATSNRAFVDISSLFDWLVKFKEFFRFLKVWRTWNILSQAEIINAWRLGHWKLKFRNFTEFFTCLKVIPKIKKLKNLENMGRIANARWKISQIMAEINSQQHEKEKEKA